MFLSGAIRRLNVIMKRQPNMARAADYIYISVGCKQIPVPRKRLAVATRHDSVFLSRFG
jgi:hypothetical protein